VLRRGGYGAGINAKAIFDHRAQQFEIGRLGRSVARTRKNTGAASVAVYVQY
jgi:hypothetical protein